MTNKSEFIPIKDAINILEDYKDALVYSNEAFPFNDSDPSKEDSSTNLVEEIHNLSIIKLAEKRYNKADGIFNTKTTTDECDKLYLYGKKSSRETEFEKVYIDLFPIRRTEMVMNFLSGKVGAERVVEGNDKPWDYSKYNCNLFENYNYTTRYDGNINYTVLGHKETNTIKYYDISVEYNEFMNLINKIFNNKSK